MKFYSDINSYIEGIDNREYVLRTKISYKRKIKVLIYNFLIMFLSPRIKGKLDKVYFINGKNQNKSTLVVDNTFRIYHGDVYNGIMETLHKPTLYSICSGVERIRLLFGALQIYKKNRDQIYDVSSWLEYIVLENFIYCSSPKEIIARGHYDEYATWLGGLSQKYKFYYSIYQHGVVVDNVRIRNKISCDNMFVFDEYSKNIFRNNIIQKNTCNFYIHDFPSNVRFERINRLPNMYYIGIAEQCNYEWTNKIVKLLSNISGIRIIIMTHPLSKKKYKKGPLITITNKKIINIDLLITENSTLALDYYRTEKSTKVIYTSYESQNTFSDYPFFCCDSLETLSEYIVKELQQND